MTMLELHRAWHNRLIEIGELPDSHTYNVKTSPLVADFLRGQLVHVTVSKPFIGFQCSVFMPPKIKLYEALCVCGLTE